MGVDLVGVDFVGVDLVAPNPSFEDPSALKKLQCSVQTDYLRQLLVLSWCQVDGESRHPPRPWQHASVYTVCSC